MMTQSMCKKVVIFDLDDTLYKEIDFLKSAYRHIASLVSNDHAPEDEVYQLMLQTYYAGGNAFEAAVTKYGFRLFSVEWMLSVYRNHKPKITLDEETRNTLDWLKAQGVVMGIISDGRMAQQINKIEALGLEEYMDPNDIIINNHSEFFKPDMRSYRRFMEKYGADCDYLYIADNPAKDFKAPNTLDWTTICLLDDGMNIHKQVFNQKPEYLPMHKISSMREILAII